LPAIARADLTPRQNNYIDQEDAGMPTDPTNDPLQRTPPDRPIYSDADVNVYSATSSENLMRQQVAQWQRERSEGTETAEMRVYRDRQLATFARDYAAVPCDRCGAPGWHNLELWGAPAAMIDYIEQTLGVAVPGGRERLLAAHALDPTTTSHRVLVFCRAHHPNPERNIVIQDGHEGAAMDPFWGGGSIRRLR
jgi:hypothetical protein